VAKPASFDPNAAALPGSGIFGLTSKPAESQVHLIPVPFEATTSYGGGTSRGPAAILEASRQVDLHDLDCGPVYEAGIVMLPESRRILELNRAAKKAAAPIIACGGDVAGRPALRAGLEAVNRASEEVNRIVAASAAEALAGGRLVGIVGGDHSAPFGAIAVIAASHPGVGILHIDAHCDLRPAYEGFTWSHASIMRNVYDRIPGVARIVQVGIRDAGSEEIELAERSGRRIVVHPDGAIARAGFQGVAFAVTARRIVRDLPEEVYVSFDIDGLDPALCPHTGTPVPGGLSFRQACFLLEELVRARRRIVGFDLCEVAPGPAGDEWDANVGARVLYRLIGFAMLSRAHTPSPPRRRRRATSRG
jgi:agmatinase